MSDTDEVDVDEVRENLPDDIDARATELKRRGENRELTDAEKQVVAEDIQQMSEDIQQMADALRPIIRELNNILLDFASNISDTLEQETDE